MFKKRKEKYGWSFHMLVKLPIPVYVGGSWPEYGLDFMPIIKNSGFTDFWADNSILCSNDVGRRYFNTFYEQMAWVLVAFFSGCSLCSC